MDSTEIIDMSLQEAYTLFNMLRVDARENKAQLQDEYTRARFGITHKFDIYSYLKERYTAKEKSSMAVIEGKTIAIQDLFSEVEAREALIKRVLIREIGDTDILRPRE